MTTNKAAFNDNRLIAESDPKWVARLATGANLFFSASLIGVFFRGESIPIIGPIGDLLIDFTALAGAWLLTTPEQGHAHENQRLRQLTRTIAVGTFAADVVFATMTLLSSSQLNTIRTLRMMSSILTLTFLAFHMARLAVRIPDRSLAKHLRLFLPALALFAGTITLAASTIKPLIRDVNNLGPPTSTLLLTAFVIGILSYLGLTACGMWQLFQFKRAMERQARAAERSANAA